MPATAVEATVKVRAEVPAPVIDVGLNAAVTPVGKPETESAIAESKPPLTVLVTVDDPAAPCATETAVAERLKLGDVVVDPVKAANNPEFGDPHPVTRSYPVTAE